MAFYDDQLCPNCGVHLLIDVEQASGAHVVETARIVGWRPMEVPVEAPAATPAAAAHADALGVDLTQVEGTGVDGTILKSDVTAAAEPAAEPQPETAPAPSTEQPVESQAPTEATTPEEAPAEAAPVEETPSV